jgi:hypothetical protein
MDKKVHIRDYINLLTIYVLAPPANDQFKFGQTPAPAPMFGGTQPANAVPVAFNFGGNTSLGSNPFSFTGSTNTAPATNNAAARMSLYNIHF